MNKKKYRDYYGIIFISLLLFCCKNYFQENNKPKDSISKKLNLEKSDSFVRCYNGGKILIYYVK